MGDDLLVFRQFLQPILDVRTPAETGLGMIDGAVNIPVDELQDGYKPRSKFYF